MLPVEPLRTTELPGVGALVEFSDRHPCRAGGEQLLGIDITAHGVAGKRRRRPHEGAGLLRIVEVIDQQLDAIAVGYLERGNGVQVEKSNAPAPPRAVYKRR
jgi:hypothetical protein